MGTTNRLNFATSGRVSPETLIVETVQEPVWYPAPGDDVETDQVMPGSSSVVSAREAALHFGGVETIDSPLGNPASSDWDEANGGYSIIDTNSRRA